VKGECQTKDAKFIPYQRDLSNKLFDVTRLSRDKNPFFENCLFSDS